MSATGTTDVPLPPLKDGEYLADFLIQAGPVSDGMSISGLSWREITAWREATGWAITPWAMKALSQLSKAYAAEYRASADNPARTPPYLGEMTKKRASTLEASALAVLG